MSNLSRRLFKQGLERAVQRGATLISNKEFDVGAAVRSLIDHAHSSGDPADDVRSNAEVHDRSLTETLFNVVRSVDSVHDLKSRVTSHRREFANFARSSRSELVALLTKIAEPPGRNESVGGTSSLPPSGGSVASGDSDRQPPSKDM